MLELILNDLLNYYFSLDDYIIETMSKNSMYAPKERVTTINNMKIVIYSNDHNPPHFHVLSNDNHINAKFSIETGRILSGQISPKNIKKIDVFYNSPKTQIILQSIWEKNNKLK